MLESNGEYRGVPRYHRSLIGMKGKRLSDMKRVMLKTAHPASRSTWKADSQSQLPPALCILLRSAGVSWVSRCVVLTLVWAVCAVHQWYHAMKCSIRSALKCLVLLYPFSEMLGNGQRSCLQSTTAHVTVNKINDSNAVFLKQKNHRNSHRNATAGSNCTSAAPNWPNRSQQTVNNGEQRFDNGLTTVWRRCQRCHAVSILGLRTSRNTAAVVAQTLDHSDAQRCAEMRSDAQRSTVYHLWTGDRMNMHGIVMAFPLWWNLFCTIFSLSVQWVARRKHGGNVNQAWGKPSPGFLLTSCENWRTMRTDTESTTLNSQPKHIKENQRTLSSFHEPVVYQGSDTILMPPVMTLPHKLKDISERFEFHRATSLLQLFTVRGWFVEVSKDLQILTDIYTLHRSQQTLCFTKLRLGWCGNQSYHSSILSRDHSHHSRACRAKMHSAHMKGVEDGGLAMSERERKGQSWRRKHFVKLT